MNADGNFIRCRSRGFALVTAIFLLVTLAALGAFMVTISNSQHATSAQDVQGTRAYWAAKGGVQWAGAVIIATNACPAIATPAFTDGFTVTVGCTSYNHTEGVTSRRIFWITSTATAGGAVGALARVERQIQVFLE